MAARWGNFAKSGQQSCMCQFSCFTAVTSVRMELPMGMVTQTQAHAQPRHTCPKVPQTCIALWCRQYRMVLLTQTAACAAAKGDFTASHTFLELMLVSLLSRQYLGKGAVENQPKGKIMTHVQLETLPDSVCHRSLLLVTVQARLWTCASLVPFGDSVKLDLCTWNPRLVHTGQT